jgi:pimeloyl-ACP methyl ester carboxylesterase
LADATINGVHLYYELAGHGPASLVLVHGSWGDHHNWDGVAPDLARSFRVVTYARRGHSESGPAPEPGSIEDDVLDLAGLIEHLHLAPAHVAGSSLGASIALKLAAARPELFATLIAHEPPLFEMLEGNPVGAEVRTALMSVAARLGRGDTEGGARQFVEEVAFGPGAWDAMPEGTRRKFMSNAPTFLDEIRESGAYTVNLARLSRFDRPVLLTEGDQSHPFFRPILDQIASALPTATRHTFAGAGHVPHLTHPAQYVNTIVEFARDHEP